MNNNQKFTSYKDMIRNKVKLEKISEIASGICRAKIICKFCAYDLICTSSIKDNKEVNQ